MASGGTCKQMRKEIWLDRTADQALVRALVPGGELRPVVEFRNDRQEIMDLQFRRPSGRVSRMSLYAGLTRILDIDARTIAGKDPEFRFFIAHETHRRRAGNMDAWGAWQPLHKLVAHWPDVERYLLKCVEWFATEPSAAHHVIEGRVHAAMCRNTVGSYRVINREASPSFRDQPTKARVCGRIRDEIRRVLAAVHEPKPWLQNREFGTSPDILAVDNRGRLVVAEAKPFSYTSGIVKGPIQTRFYSGLIARWLEADPDARAILRTMLAQRIDVGLAKGPAPTFSSKVPILPVLALGAGEVSKRALEHATELRDSLSDLNPSEAGATEATEIWRLRPDGDIEEKL